MQNNIRFNQRGTHQGTHTLPLNLKWVPWNFQHDQNQSLPNTIKQLGINAYTDIYIYTDTLTWSRPSGGSCQWRLKQKSVTSGKSDRPRRAEGKRQNKMKSSLEKKKKKIYMNTTSFLCTSFLFGPSWRFTFAINY